jgi:hypothetical protein
MAYYGLQLVKSYNGMQSMGGEVGANSTTFTLGDPLTFDTDGFLIVATAGTRIVGVCKKAMTTSSDNETVAQAKVPFAVSDYLDLYEAEMSAAVSATNRSQYADLTGTTGAVLIDQTTLNDDTGQFRIATLDPRGESSTTRVLVNIAEPEHLAYTQN